MHNYMKEKLFVYSSSQFKVLFNEKNIFSISSDCKYWFFSR